jgi:hypothetical protein
VDGTSGLRVISNGELVAGEFLMKKLLARGMLRWYLPRFLNDSHAFNRLLGNAVRLQLGRMTDEAFRECLADFYQQLDASSIKRDLDFEGMADRLNRPGGYKIAVSGIGGAPPSAGKPGRFDFWGRRFGLLKHLGIGADVLLLRQGEQVPPHGHHRVVSGFYVLEGEVAIRHYDRVREEDGKLLVRKVLDTDLCPGGFTTNSEHYHNIHWLQGLAEKSYLFRVTVTDTPTSAFTGVKTTNSRVYVDPSGEPNGSDIITAPYVSEAAAKQLRIRPLIAR